MSTRFKNGSSDDIIGPASTLASGVSVGATSMTVATGTGDRFPVVASPDIAYVTLQNATKVEIVKITARAAGADTMTIVKAQEGTTDRAWLTGDVVSMRITAAQAESAVNAQDVAAAALTAHEAAGDPHPGYTTAAELSAALAGKQDADADLTAIATLVTTAYGRSLLTSVDAATLFAAIKQVATTSATGAVELATGAECTSGAAGALAVPASELPAAVAALATPVPAGCVSHFAMNTPPAGWLKANGAAVSRTSYAALFSAIGTTFGAGDGSTTFNLPDLRGEFIRNWDDGRGVDSGRAFGSAQGGAMESHSHTIAVTGQQVGSGTTALGVGGTSTPVATSSTGTGSENRPRNIALLACIKY